MLFRVWASRSSTGGAKRSTAWPIMIALRCSRNRLAWLPRSTTHWCIVCSELSSDETRAKYNEAKRRGQENKRFLSLSVWTPNVNIFRDPRWGRGQETYGEDPYLTSRMGVSVVKGLQGPSDAKYRELLACGKHFAVHSGPESSRHTINLNNVDPRDLYETYLPAFKALVQDAGRPRDHVCVSAFGR